MHTVTLLSGWMYTRACRWARAHGVLLLRISLGVVLLWFGALKFFPSLSPAQDLAIRTIDKLTFGVVPAPLSVVVLAVWECTIGLGLLFGIYTRAALLLLFLQMSGTLTSILFFPQEMFTFLPYAPTLEGQYVIKNLVLISAGVVIGGALQEDAEVNDRTFSARAPASYRVPGRRWREFTYRIYPRFSLRPARQTRREARQVRSN